MKYIGLMSGTSLDGLDIAYCSIDGFYTSTNVQLLAYKEVKMPKQLKEKIQFACNHVIKKVHIQMISVH